MKQLLTILLLTVTLSLLAQTTAPAFGISDTGKGPTAPFILKAGSCASPDGPMNAIIGTPSGYTWLQSNGYCNPNTYGTNPTVCWTFTPSSSTIQINSGYSQSGCANVSFGGFTLYDASCSQIGTGLSYTGLNTSQSYTFCMSASAWGGGPSCTGFDDFCPYFENISVLPIELIEFGGRIESGRNELYWITASELNNEYFKLEVSTDAENWKLVKTIGGAGTSNIAITYSVDHYYPSNAINYYRLSQVDYDGKSETFDLIALDNRITPKQIWRVYDIQGVVIQDVSKFRGMMIIQYTDGTTTKRFKHTIE